MPNDKSKKAAATKRASARAAGRTAAQASSKAQARKTTGMKRASARAAGRTRTTMATPGKVTEAGVTGASVAKLVTGLAKSFGKSKPKPKPSSSSSSSSPKWRDFGEEKRAAKAYYDRQRQVPITEAKENAAKRAAASKRPSAAERKAAEYRASADRIERMQAGYKYKGGSGTKGGYRRGW